MEHSSSDPCSTCDIEQKCCRSLRGLKLSEAEYDLNFAQHNDQLDVRRRGPFVIVSMKPGLPCPHWSDFRCTIHETRPVECRLYPHSISDLAQKDGRVFVSLHSRTECPHKDELLAPIEDAKAMALALVKDACGEQIAIEVVEEGFVSRWKHRIHNIARKIVPKKIELTLVKWRDRAW